jgi:hypothetical protein
MFEPKENKGNLFKNKKKEKDTHADYKGTCNIAGTMYWMNAWINRDKNGDPYMGMTFNPVEEKYKQGQQQQQKVRVVGGKDVDKPDPSDDVPF